jgi:uncharacterized membrane protein
MWNEHPLYMAGMLCLLMAVSVWLSRFKGFKLAGSPILIILLCAIAANTGLMPTGASNQVLYNGIFTYVAPLSIFILLLEVDLKSLRKAGGPMLLLFLAGAFATVAGILISYFIWQPASSIGPLAHAIAGMYTGTYIGGSINFNAVAMHYGVMKDGDLFAATTVVDNIIGTPWIILALLIPRWLHKIWPQKRIGISAMENKLHKMGEQQINIPSLAIMMALGFFVIYISEKINDRFANIPAVLVLTTIALIIAQVPAIKRIKGLHTIGLFLTLIFLGVIGTLCDVKMLFQSGETALVLLGFAGIAVLLHGIILFGIAGLLKMDWDLAAMASLTNIGGSTTAIAGSEGLNRPDLLLPGILVGSLGNAIGTYVGFAVAGWLGG